MVSYRQLTAITGEHSVPPRSEHHKIIIILEGDITFFSQMVQDMIITKLSNKILLKLYNTV